MLFMYFFSFFNFNIKVSGEFNFLLNLIEDRLRLEIICYFYFQAGIYITVQLFPFLFFQLIGTMCKNTERIRSVLLTKALLAKWKLEFSILCSSSFLIFRFKLLLLIMLKYVYREK